MTDKTTTPEDAENTAVALSPAFVTEVQDDPELLVRLTRGQLAIVQDRMVRKLLGNPDASSAQFAVVHEALSKNAKITKSEGATSGQGFSVVINLQGPKPPTEIDVTPVLPDAA